jgi:hypothetical protein
MLLAELEHHKKSNNRNSRNRSLRRRKRKKEKTPKSAKEIYDDRTFAAFISTFLISSSFREIYALYDSFILDSALTIYIYNNPERFQTLQEAEKDNYLITGASRVSIEGYSTVEIAFQLSDAVRKITLDNVALVPSFHTNIVSLDRLMQRDVH